MTAEQLLHSAAGQPGCQNHSDLEFVMVETMVELREQELAYPFGWVKVQGLPNYYQMSSVSFPGRMNYYQLKKKLKAEE